jgi:hypothetical protein
MNLTTRLAKLEKHQPQIDQEQRQKMIASIEQWLVELEEKAQTDPGTRLYLEAIRGMLAEKRSAPRGQFAGAKSGSFQGRLLQAAKVDVAAVAAPVIR